MMSLKQTTHTNNLQGIEEKTEHGQHTRFKRGSVSLIHVQQEEFYSLVIAQDYKYKLCIYREKLGLLSNWA